MRLLLLIFQLYLASKTGLTLYFAGILRFSDIQLSFHAWKSLLKKRQWSEHLLFTVMFMQMVSVVHLPQNNFRGY